MISDTTYWNNWEQEYRRQSPIDVDENFRLMDAMYEETRQLGLLPAGDSLEGLEPIILYAKAINVPIPSRPAV